MITCSYCGHSNLDGTLFCESCGFALWSNAADATSTQKLDENDSNDISVKSGWGTATFQNQNQIVIHIRDAPEPMVIHPGKKYVLGRSDKSSGISPDLDLTNYAAVEKGVSRIHAALQRGEEVVSLIDLDSANGTFLNGQRLASHQPRILRDGDEIRLGGLILHIYFK